MINKDFITRGAVEVPVKDPETFEKVNKVNDKFVVRYCHHTKQLIGTARQKARAYFNQKKIRYDPDQKCFFIDPIQGCHTIHQIERKKVGFECSCQKCQEKMKKGEYNPDKEDKAVCSHIGGLFLWFKLRRKQK